MTTYTRNTLSGSLAPVNNELEKIEVSLREKLDRNPSVAQNNEMLDDLDMNSNRIINYPDAVNDSDLITKGQVASLAPVQTVNGQTGNVSIPTQIQIDNGVVFDNIAEMKSSSLEIGQLVRCKRYYALGDLVEGLEFEVQATGSGIFYNLANGNSAVFQNDGLLSFKQLGCVGDGTTDDTVNFDNALSKGLNFRGVEGEVYRLTDSVTLQDNTTISGAIEIFVDHTTSYKRQLQLGNNCVIDGLRFRGTGVALPITPTYGGQERQIAISSVGKNNNKVINCSFYDFVDVSINTGTGVVGSGDSDGFTVEKCYFDESNFFFKDISHAYRTRNTITTENISYSSSDMFLDVSLVSSGDISGTVIADTSHHIVTNNIHIKNRGQTTVYPDIQEPRHGILAHYAGGDSHLICTGNIIANCGRHGIYLRGMNDLNVDIPTGPNIIQNNIVRFCGGNNSFGEYFGLNNGIQIECQKPSIVSNNIIEDSGYYPNGTARATKASGIGGSRGMKNIVITGNQIHRATGIGMVVTATTGDRTVENVNISGNNISGTVDAGILVGVASGVAPVFANGLKVNDNTINFVMTTETRYAGVVIDAEAGITGSPLGTAFEVFRNTIRGGGKVVNTFGVAYRWVAGLKMRISQNTISDVGDGTVNYRFTSGSVATAPHRAVGQDIIHDDNRFKSCTYPVRVYRASAGVLAFIHPTNTFEDCDFTVSNNVDAFIFHPVAGKVIGPTASAGVDANVEIYAISFPTVALSWSVGDRVRNATPAPAGWEGWVCTTAGSAGTWKGFGLIDA